MTAPSDRTLLRDLAKLLAKYPLSEWEKLISALGDEARRQETTEAIRALMPLTRLRQPSKASHSEGVASRLEEIRRTDPEKAELLASLKQQLQRKRLFPRAPSLREFAAMAGLKQALPPRREQAINEVITYLSSLSITELYSALRQRVRSERDLGAEYERWVELILDPKSGRADPSDRGEGLVNSEQLRKQVGSQLRLRPVAERVDIRTGQPLSPMDDLWTLLRVDRGSIELSNLRTQHVVTLGNDNIREFRSPDFLILRCQLKLTLNRVLIEPLVTPFAQSDTTTEVEAPPGQRIFTAHGKERGGLRFTCIRCNLPIEDDIDMQIPPAFVGPGKMQLQAAHKTPEGCERAKEKWLRHEAPRK